MTIYLLFTCFNLPNLQVRLEIEPGKNPAPHKYGIANALCGSTPCLHHPSNFYSFYYKRKPLPQTILHLEHQPAATSCNLLLAVDMSHADAHC